MKQSATIWSAFKASRSVLQTNIITSNEVPHFQQILTKTEGVERGAAEIDEQEQDH